MFNLSHGDFLTPNDDHALVSLEAGVGETVFVSVTKGYEVELIVHDESYDVACVVLAPYEAEAVAFALLRAVALLKQV
jgi:hypothetical protein